MLYCFLVNIQIQRLKPNRYEEAIEVIRRSIRISQKGSYSPEIIEYACNKYKLEKFIKKAQEREYFVAVDTEKDKIVGIIGLKDNEVRTFFVDPDQQKKGIGKMLYFHIEEIAKTRNIQKMIVTSSPIGEKAYTKYGFKKVGTKENEYEGIKFIESYMEKELLEQ